MTSAKQHRFQRCKLRFMAHCHRAWSRNFVLLLLLIFLQWPVLLWGSYHRYLLTHIGVMALDSFLVIAGCFYFMAMAEALPRRAWRQRLFAFFLLVLAVLFALEVFAIRQYGTLFGEGLLTVILETNPAEAVEYLCSVRFIVLSSRRWSAFSWHPSISVPSAGKRLSICPLRRFFPLPCRLGRIWGIMRNCGRICPARFPF